MPHADTPEVVLRLARGFNAEFRPPQPRPAERALSVAEQRVFEAFVARRNAVRAAALDALRDIYVDEHRRIHRTRATSEARNASLARNKKRFTRCFEREVALQRADAAHDRSDYECTLRLRARLYDDLVKHSMREHLASAVSRAQIKAAYEARPELFAQFQSLMAGAEGFSAACARRGLANNSADNERRLEVSLRDKHGGMCYGDARFPPVPRDMECWQRLPSWWHRV